MRAPPYTRCRNVGTRASGSDSITDTMRASIVGTTNACVTRSSRAVRSHASAEKLGSGTTRRPAYVELSTAATPATWNGGTTVGEEGFESRSHNSWCDGCVLTGRVLMTVAAGQVAYRLRSFSLGVAQ